MQFVGPRLRMGSSPVQGPPADPRLTDLYQTFEQTESVAAVGALVRPSIDDPVPMEGPQLRLAARPDQLKMGPQSTDGLPLAAPHRASPPQISAPTIDQPEWLYGQLERLAREPRCSVWAWRTSALLRKLHSPEARHHVALQATLHGHLAASIQEANWLAAEVEPELVVTLRRVRHAMVRRLDIWQLASAIEHPTNSTVVAQSDHRNLSRSVAELAALTSLSTTGEGWQQYLMLDALRSAAIQPNTNDAQQLARQILSRLESRDLDAEQRNFINRGALARLTHSLRHLAAEPLDMAEVVSRLERFERSGSVEEGRRVVEQLQHLSSSPQDAARRLAERIELHYRNCNVRVAVADELLSRMLPQQDVIHEPVRDSILGVPVRGQSETFTSLRVRTIPHDSRLLLALEAHGAITAHTVSESGPATLFNDAWSNYVVSKRFEITPRGLRVERAQAEAQSRTRLRNFETNFDGIPLLGSLVRNVVEKRVAEGTPAARQEIKRKVETKALRHMDEQADERLATAGRRFEEQALGRLAGLSLTPTMAAMQTTEQRAILRVRLATDDQLAAHTPRPQAPSDSVLSLQLHESALNNVIAQLDLDGRQFLVPELHLWIAEKLQLPAPDLASLRHEEASIRFAEQDAVQVLCREDRAQVTLSLAEVANGPHRWSNFSVRVFYRPESSGLHAELVRDGTIQLIGYGLGAKGQVALRGIFSKMFSKERRWNLVPEQLADDTRLDAYEVTQLVIDDGWIGLALGPRQRTAICPSPGLSDHSDRPPGHGCRSAPFCNRGSQR